MKKFFKILLKNSAIMGALFVISMSTPAIADLSRYTSEELLAEVGRRIDAQGGGGGGGGGAFDIDISCNQDDLKIAMYSAAKSDSKTFKDLNYQFCNKQRDYLKPKYAGTGFSGFKKFKICRDEVAVTLTVTSGGVRIDEEEQHANYQICGQQTGIPR